MAPRDQVDGAVLRGPRLPHWKCSAKGCGEKENWASRIYCRSCARAAPPWVRTAAEKADKGASRNRDASRKRASPRAKNGAPRCNAASASAGGPRASAEEIAVDSDEDLPDVSIDDRPSDAPAPEALIQKYKQRAADAESDGFPAAAEEYRAKIKELEEQIAAAKKPPTSARNAEFAEQRARKAVDRAELAKNEAQEAMDAAKVLLEKRETELAEARKKHAEKKEARDRLREEVAIGVWEGEGTLEEIEARVAFHTQALEHAARQFKVRKPPPPAMELPPVNGAIAAIAAAKGAEGAPLAGNVWASDGTFSQWVVHSGAAGDARTWLSGLAARAVASVSKMDPAAGDEEKQRAMAESLQTCLDDSSLCATLRAVCQASSAWGVADAMPAGKRRLVEQERG